MNVFYLDPDPVKCAKMHVDKHVVKMIVEYAQLLSTAHRVLDGNESIELSKNGRKIKRYRFPNNLYKENTLYLACHVSHPSAVWVRQSSLNYRWLYDLFVALCDEYTYRYGKRHSTDEKLRVSLAVKPINIPQKAFTQPTPAMSHYPDCIVEGDSLKSYHNYYIEAKNSFAKWTKRSVPSWYQLAH